MFWRNKATLEHPERKARPLGALSDTELQQRALSVASDREATITEALFRTRDALLDSQEATNALTERIRGLTRWLVVLTVAIPLLTAMTVWPTAPVAIWNAVKHLSGR